MENVFSWRIGKGVRQHPIISMSAHSYFDENRNLIKKWCSAHGTDYMHINRKVELPYMSSFIYVAKYWTRRKKNGTNTHQHSVIHRKCVIKTALCWIKAMKFQRAFCSLFVFTPWKRAFFYVLILYSKWIECNISTPNGEFHMENSNQTQPNRNETNSAELNGTE